jgi:rSAM/selenodomain-associated transferase 1
MQLRLTGHTLEVAGEAASACSALQRLAVDLRLAVDGVGPGALRRWQQAIRRRCGWPDCGGLEVRTQGGGNLGCRMQRQLQLGFAAGAERVVLIGTDLPALEWRDLTAALMRLQADPLVIGPAVDGGYWLIGMNRNGFRRAGAQLMSGIGWGGPEVLTQTLERAGRMGIPAVLLRHQQDLDDRSDLAAWMRPAGSQGGLLPAAPWR